MLKLVQTCPDAVDAHHELEAVGSLNLDELCRMVNGDLLGGLWVHHCWDPDTQKPCCKNQQETEEKTTICCINALHGRSMARPTESRWTNTLPNFQMSLLRRVVYRVGLDCFHIDVAALPPPPRTIAWMLIARPRLLTFTR